MNLNQVTVPAVDVARSVEFYERIGLKKIVQTHPGYARFECPDGEATFSVHEVDSVAIGAAAVIYFECDDLDTKVTKLKSDGIVFESDPVDQIWLWREAYLRDPAGNLICLYNAGVNRRFPPWRQG